jgi:hypothetical protein
MNESSNSPWTPDPQLLAAYFDGELEGRDDVAEVRAQIEAWLETHPEAKEEWRRHRELQELWLDTTPADPGPAAWNQVLDQIDARRQVEPRRSRRAWWAAGIIAASVALLVGSFIVASRFTPQEPEIARVQPKQVEPEEVEVFPVAAASEITIIWIDGADASAMIVGDMPLEESMELVAAGDIRVVTCCPKTHVRQGENQRPMVHARADTASPAP